jgi:hypothetical protein
LAQRKRTSLPKKKLSRRILKKRLFWFVLKQKEKEEEGSAHICSNCVLVVVGEVPI